MTDKVTTVDEAGVVLETASTSTAVAEFDPIAAGLAQLTADIAGTTYDITTTKGLDTAKRLRALCVKLRTNAGEVYDSLNRPMLDKQRQIRDLKKQFIDGVELLETPIDLAIKAQEKVKEQERQARVAAEELRVKALRDKIAVIAGLPAKAVLRDAAGIAALDQALTTLEVSEALFAEFTAEATELKTFVRGQLSELFVAASGREAEAERVRQESERLEAERQQQALRTARLQSISDLRAYPLRAIGQSLQKIQALMDAFEAPIKETYYGDLMDAATEAYNEAWTQLDGIRAARIAEDKAAEDRRRQEQLAAEARKREDADRADRQRIADEGHAAQARLLQNQQDAFEAERKESQRLSDEKEANQAAERKKLQDQIDALQPKPAPTVKVAQVAAAPVTLAALAAATVSPPVVAQVAREMAIEAARPSDALIVSALADVFDAGIADVIEWLRAFNADAVTAEFEAESVAS